MSPLFFPIANLIAPGSSLLYKYSTSSKLSVAGGQNDVQSKITADVHIKGSGDCNYAVQLRNVKITETYDEKDETVSLGDSQKDLESTIVRFRWIDGLIVLLEADQSAKVENVNFIKGVLSTLQVTSPVAADGTTIVREEDVHGVCTTRYSFEKQGGNTQINKDKQLSTCSKDKLFLSASPVLTTLLGPLIDKVFSSETRYVCKTSVNGNKQIQTVKCKIVEITEEHGKSGSPHNHGDKDSDEDDTSSEELIKYDDSAKDDDDEGSSKVIYIKQEITLQTGAANLDGTAIRNVNRQTLQFVPSATYARTNEKVEALSSKIQGLLNSKDWDQLAASRFLEVANELRQMDRSSLNFLKGNPQLKQLVSTFMNTVYADQTASLLNLDETTLKFNNPLAVYYIDNPSVELVDQIIRGARKLNAEQVEDFVGPAATIIKHYAARRNKNADEVMIKLIDVHYKK
ncbi:unnamed protein product [Didymodactylos carnosus]|uniref:Vitellogenin domain-containing protein n=1 Tax=Didymodactylos carnosus TaxID=1234261 RepID=A0A8S2E4S6_9BILA|nr:unnamed protein product [Didymodactylos carnosus]CAF3878798.1 unnamed protein product [Didymodactylos carnosus]